MTKHLPVLTLTASLFVIFVFWFHYSEATPFVSYIDEIHTPTTNIVVVCLTQPTYSSSPADILADPFCQGFHDQLKIIEIEKQSGKKTVSEFNCQQPVYQHLYYTTMFQRPIVTADSDEFLIFERRYDDHWVDITDSAHEQFEFIDPQVESSNDLFTTLEAKDKATTRARIISNYGPDYVGKETKIIKTAHLKLKLTIDWGSFVIESASSEEPQVIYEFRSWRQIMTALFALALLIIGVSVNLKFATKTGKKSSNDPAES